MSVNQDSNGFPEPPPRSVGTFLTPSGIERVHKVFSQYTESQPAFSKKQIDKWLREAGFVDGGIGEDASFDDWYFCIYLLRLTGEDKLLVNSKNVSTDLKEIFRLRTMHKLSLGDAPNLNNFSETLVDEHTVADILLFTNSVKNLIPYETHMRSIETGCLWFEFSVYGFPKKTVNELPFLKKADIEASINDTKHPEWAALKRRFKIEASELYPL